jgi:DNA-binding CsgD family transcriptional regulator/PAS domain-containing protein
MDSLADLSSLIGLIYEAAVEPARWPEFLQAFSDAMGEVPVNLLYQDLNNHQGTISAIARMDPEALRKYNADFSGSDPWIVEADKRAVLHAGSVQIGDALVPRTELVKTEYYTEIARPFGLTGLLGAVIRRDGAAVSIISAFQHHRPEPFSAADIQVLRLLLPHFQRAMRVHQHLASVTLGKRLIEDVLDSLRIGVILARDDSSVAFINSAAEAILEERDPLATTAGRLTAAGAGQTRELRALVRAAAHGNAENAWRSGGALAVSRPSLRRPLSVIVIPLRAEALTRGDNARRVAALFVTDPERSVETDVDVLQRLWALTPTEAKIASMLAGGHTIASISDRCTITNATVRWHLKNVLAKTQTSRQVDLVRLLTMGPRSISGSRARPASGR